MCRFRVFGMNGPEPIRLDDIKDWCEMTGSVIHRSEFAIIFAMDAAFRDAWQDERDAQEARRSGG